MRVLVRNLEEERHVSDNVPIGECNPKLFNIQWPSLEEWDGADDDNLGDAKYVDNDAAIYG